MVSFEPFSKVPYFVIPLKAGIQNSLIPLRAGLDSGSRFALNTRAVQGFACPE
jgi:hypothetical protein